MWCINSTGLAGIGVIANVIQVVIIHGNSIVVGGLSNCTT